MPLEDKANTAGYMSNDRPRIRSGKLVENRGFPHACTAFPDSDPGAADAVDHSVHGMRGLVLGLEVKPRAGATSVSTASSGATPRRLRLFAQTAPNRFQQRTGSTYETAPGYAFLLREEGQPAPPTDLLPLMSPPLLLHKDEPVAITVVNRLHAPTAVHWHGIELESYADGIPGWSGTPGHIAPLMRPVIRLSPRSRHRARARSSITRIPMKAIRSVPGCTAR